MIMKNLSKWKAVILDLDGTLLYSDGRVSEYTLRMLQECKKRGVFVVIATARFWFKAEKYLDIIKPDYAILADGTQIYHNGEMVYGFSMDEGQRDGIVNELTEKKKENEFVICIGKKLLCSVKGVHEDWLVSSDFSKPMEDAAYKIAVVLDKYEEAKELAEKYDCRVYSYREESLYGFTSRNASKYQAVLKLGEMLQISLDEMLAFGDDENDYDILKNVGKGIAVANAIPMIRKIADDITSSNDEDGVAKYIEKELIPFWEKTYQEKDIVAFSNKPNMTVKEFVGLFPLNAEVLEVGCGEGQNAVYLAKQGFKVDAFDLSEYGITKVKDRCKTTGVTVNAFVADLTEYEFTQNYDVIVSFGTLHFVHKEEWIKFVNEAKKHTNVGGIHIMQLFTDVVPASPDIAPFAIGLAKDKEIKALYNDWEILQFKSYIFEDEHPGVPKHMHASDKIVARRK